MFKIPAWEDDGPKTESIFMQKVKKKEKISENNTKLLKSNHVPEKNNNVKGNGLGNESRKHRIEKDTIKSRKDSMSNTNNKKSELIDSIPETQNFDEVLLNAKKKKFNEVFENDDKEDLLFAENKQKKEKKSKDKMSPNNLIINNKKVLTKQNNIKTLKRKISEENKHTNSEEENNQNKKKKNKPKISPNNLSILSKSKEEITKRNNTKTKDPKITEDNNVTNGEVNESTQAVNNKKARLRSLLYSTSHRTTINVSKTGSKLRDRMLERLKAAQFRYLNEKLYTSSGSEAQQLFHSDPSAFETYHQGYQLQVKKWPVNPLDVIVKKIMKMPKTHLIADLGCGEAALSRRVPNKVRSFDLVATAPGVEACDMARTPLLTASMDVTVYCLALMGTDLTQYLVEANRVLKMGGHLLIAEVESRFDKVEDFAKEVERLGFKLKQLDKSNNVFFFMEFTKIRDPPVKKAKLPALTLKPCLYKRR